MLFQNTYHHNSGDLNNYRFFIGFRDSWSRNNRRFRLESRAHNYYRTLYDHGSSYAKYYYGATSLCYLNYIYFGGGMNYNGVGLGNGMHPMIGYANYDMALQNSWYMNTNGDNEMRQFMFEHLRTGHGQNDNLIVGWAPQRDYNWNMRNSQRWLIVVGRDTTTSAWRGNKGAWDWSTWTYNDYRDGSKIIDDSMGSIYDGNQDSYYITFRRWNGIGSNYQNKKQTSNYSAKVIKMWMRYLDRIYHNRYRYDYQTTHPYNRIYEHSNWGRCNTWGGSYPDCLLMRSFFKDWGGSGFGQSANAALFRNSWTNGGGYAAIMYEMGQSSYNQYSNNWINHWQSWSGMNGYFQGTQYQACNTNNNCKIDLTNTRGGYTAQYRIGDSGTNPYF
jgi:hypothetical protein